MKSSIQLLPCGLLWQAVLSASDAWKTVINLKWPDTVHETQQKIAAELVFANPVHFPEGECVVVARSRCQTPVGNTCRWCGCPGTWEYGVSTMYLDGLYQQGITLLSFGLSRIGKQTWEESAIVSPTLVSSDISYIGTSSGTSRVGDWRTGCRGGCRRCCTRAATHHVCGAPCCFGVRQRR